MDNAQYSDSSDFGAKEATLSHRKWVTVHGREGRSQLCILAIPEGMIVPKEPFAGSVERVDQRSQIATNQ